MKIQICQSLQCTHSFSKHDSEYVFSHPEHTLTFNRSTYIDPTVTKHQYNNLAMTKEQINYLYCLEECSFLQWGGKNIFCIMSPHRACRQDLEHVFFSHIGNLLTAVSHYD